MSYLGEFQTLLEQQNFSRFLHLWEEYCLADEVDGPELIKVLKMIKDSEVAPHFGEYSESILPLWRQIQKQDVADDVLRYVLDLSNTNSPLLADLATDFLKRHYQDQKDFGEKLRIVGLRSRSKFQGAIRNFELLAHMEKGNFVFHTGGWGVGEIMDISILREHALIEFEGNGTLKDISFDNAFKNLIPLSSDHFLARRFGDADLLEKEGKDDPAALIRLLLKDIGPKTAVEIKDELCDLVIPEAEWTKWWQSARARLKKDSMIKSPDSTRDPFELRLEEVSHESRLKEALKTNKKTDELISCIYNFTRDFPEILKSKDLRELLKTHLEAAYNTEEKPLELHLAHKIEIALLLEDFFGADYGKWTRDLLTGLPNLESVLNLIDIIALKKRVLVMIRDTRNDWQQLFFHLLFVLPQNTLRDYMFKELSADKASSKLLKDKVHDLLHKVSIYPEAFFWYFQKLVEDEDVPMNDPESKRQFLEAYLILIHYIEHDAEYRDLLKKMYQLFTGKRYAMVRATIQGASSDYLNEFLLLASKCQTLTKHDKKILSSLAEVVDPSIIKTSKDEADDKYDVIWTTGEGYRKVQERLQQLGTVETVDNAKEIEAARALGDLRENSEYKFALERRSRLQGEMKTLSRDLNAARILTKDDVAREEVSVGSVVDVADSKGKKVTYTILGPWDADPEQNILSFQSKMAEAMLGTKKGEKFHFQGVDYVISKIKSYFD